MKTKMFSVLMLVFFVAASFLVIRAQGRSRRAEREEKSPKMRTSTMINFGTYKATKVVGARITAGEGKRSRNKNDIDLLVVKLREKALESTKNEANAVVDVKFFTVSNVIYAVGTAVKIGE
jgi:hypothetical protein